MDKRELPRISQIHAERFYVPYMLYRVPPWRMWFRFHSVLFSPQSRKERRVFQYVFLYVLMWFKFTIHRGEHKGNHEGIESRFVGEAHKKQSAKHMIDFPEGTGYRAARYRFSGNGDSSGKGIFR